MKHTSGYRKCATTALALAVTGLVSSGRAAAWSSIRANNHAPQVNSASQPNRMAQPAPQANRTGQPAPRVAPQISHSAPSQPAQVNREREHEVEAGRYRESERPAEIIRNRAPEVDAGRRAEFERESRERRHLDIDGDRQRAYHWFG